MSEKYNYSTVEAVKNRESTTVQEYLLVSKKQLKNLKAIVATEDGWAKWRLRLRESVTNRLDKIIERLEKWTQVTIISNEIFTKVINWKNRKFVKVSIEWWKEWFLPEEYLTIDKSNKKVEVTKSNIDAPKVSLNNPEAEVKIVKPTWIKEEEIVEEEEVSKIKNESGYEKVEYKTVSNNEIKKLSKNSIFSNLMWNVTVPIWVEKKPNFWIKNFNNILVKFSENLTIS